MVDFCVVLVIFFLVFNLIKYPLEGLRKFVRGFFIGRNVEELPSEIINGQEHEPVQLVLRRRRWIRTHWAKLFVWLGYFEKGKPANPFAKQGIDPEYKKPLKGEKKVRIRLKTFRFLDPALDIYEEDDMSYRDLFMIFLKLIWKIGFWMGSGLFLVFIGNWVWGFFYPSP